MKRAVPPRGQGHFEKAKEERTEAGVDDGHDQCLDGRVVEHTLDWHVKKWASDLARRSHRGKGQAPTYPDGDCAKHGVIAPQSGFNASGVGADGESNQHADACCEATPQSNQVRREMERRRGEVLEPSTAIMAAMGEQAAKARVMITPLAVLPANIT